MKKLLLLLFGLQAMAFAQTIPNGAFENWTNTQIDNPDHWFSANMERHDEIAVFTVSKVTGSVGSAIRLETKSFGTEIMESWISTTDGDPRTGQGGYSYTQKPATLTGKYRCNVMVGDTAFLVGIFKKNGIIMGGVNCYFTGSVNSFTSFTFNVMIGGEPDSVILAAGSSNLINEIGVQAGSWLELDELAFGGAGVTQPILNGDFEQWTTINETAIQNWFLFGKDGVSRENDAFRGTYAIKLTTINDPQDGLRQCGIKLSNENNGEITKRGVPYKILQDTLFGYYKLSSPGMDNGYIFARTYKNGNQVGWFGENLMPSSTYKYFQIIINNSIEPDSIDVVVESSSQSSMIAGTTLIIDEIQLTSSKLNTSGMKASLWGQKPSIVIYPNPALDELTIQSEIKGAMDIYVFKMNGEELLHQYIGSDRDRKIDIQELNVGMYLIYVQSEEGKFHYTKFIKN
ncbi:MAG: Secretion system C-terminal sorting domain [Bacteroidota bacterium]|jgi:hypothetical protein